MSRVRSLLFKHETKKFMYIDKQSQSVKAGSPVTPDEGNGGRPGKSSRGDGGGGII